MKFRVVVIGEEMMFVHSRTDELLVGGTFKIKPEDTDLFRVRSFAYAPIGSDEPEMLIGAERVV